MESTNKTIIKAIFLFPLTKSLKIQYERLSQEPDKYEVIEVDNPLEAGQVLSMEKCGILFSSDNKKILKCLEKYEKLFTDSKFKIILVLPKRIIGKEVLDLNNRGVQDILVEPITEKALTTKVLFNFQMILKLLDAALKQAKRMEDLAKAKEEAIALRKTQEEKKKQKAEERLKQVSADKFWQEKQKAEQALMFKPVSGKMEGTDNLNVMEKSTASLAGFNMFNKGIEGFQKTIKEKVEEIEQEEIKKKKKSDFIEKDHQDKYLNGDKKTNESEELQNIQLKKNGLNLEGQELEQKKYETGKDNTEADALQSQEKHKGGVLLPDTDIKLKTQQDEAVAADNIEEHLKKNLKNFEEENLKRKSSGKIEEKEDASQKKEKSALIQSADDEMKKFDKSAGSTDNLEDPKDKKSLNAIEGEELSLTKSSATNSAADELSQNDKNKSNLENEDIGKVAKGTSKTNEELENNLKSKTSQNESVDEALKKSSVKASEESLATNSKGATSTATDDASGLVKNGASPLSENHDLQKKSATQGSNENENTKENHKTGGLILPEDAEKNATEGAEVHGVNNKDESHFAEASIDVHEKSAGDTDDVQKHEKSKGTYKDEVEAVEVAKVGDVFDGEIKKIQKYEDNFVDEFTKKKNEEAEKLFTIDMIETNPGHSFTHADVNAVTFDEPPKEIIKANLQALDMGIILLHKLSVHEQKIEEQNYVFPFIAKKMFELYQVLISFYVVDSKGTPTLLHSSHVERKEFYASLKLPPIEEHVAKNLLTWSQYRYSTLNDDTLHSDLIELIYPFKDGSKMLGLAVLHAYKTLKESNDVSKLEMLIEFTRGYFLRFHNIGAQSSGKSKASVEVVAEVVPWYKKYIKAFTDWLDKGKNQETDSKKNTKNSKDKKKVVPLKKPPKKGAA